MRAHRLGCLRPFSAAAGPRSQAAGLRGWRLPRQSAQHELGEKGPAGPRSKPRGARARVALSPGNGGAQAPCLGRAPLLAWAGLCSPRAAGFFFRERLPWVTRLRGDTALPSPSGNLSIGEIDNPQRCAAHPLCSPCCGARWPKVAPLAGRGRCPDPSSAMTWPLQLVGEAPKGSLGEPPPDDCSQGLLRVLYSTATAAGTRGAPLWLGQNFVECRSCFFPL